MTEMPSVLHRDVRRRSLCRVPAGVDREDSQRAAVRDLEGRHAGRRPRARRARGSGRSPATSSPSIPRSSCRRRAETAAYCRVTGLVQPGGPVRGQPSGRMERPALHVRQRRLRRRDPSTAGGRASRRNTAIAKGFAVAQTNTGHDADREPLARFAASPQKLVDYAYRAVHVTAVTAKAVARAYYRRARVAVLLRRLLDGRAAGAHLRAAVPRGLRRHRRRRARAGLHGDDDALREDPAGAGRRAAVRREGAAGGRRGVQELRAGDGVEDGVIADPRAARSIRRATCRAATARGEPARASPTHDIASLKAIYGGVKVERPARSSPVFRSAAEAFAATPGGPRSGWDPWFIRTGPADRSRARSRRRSSSTWRRPATEHRLADVRCGARPAKLETISALLNATDPDLAPFRARGGKILMYLRLGGSGAEPDDGRRTTTSASARRWARRRRTSSACS